MALITSDCDAMRAQQNAEIRQCAVVLVGRLTERNPAHVLPCLRTTLIQLLAEMGDGDDGRREGESAMLLALLIRSSPRLAEPYVAPVRRAPGRFSADPQPFQHKAHMPAVAAPVVACWRHPVGSVQVLTALTARLEDPNCSAVEAANVLGAIGELSAVKTLPFATLPLPFHCLSQTCHSLSTVFP